MIAAARAAAFGPFVVVEVGAGRERNAAQRLAKARGTRRDEGFARGQRGRCDPVGNLHELIRIGALIPATAHGRGDRPDGRRAIAVAQTVGRGRPRQLGRGIVAGWITLDLFTRPTWLNVLTLLAGVILAPGRRTVTAALRTLGRERDRDFCTFHRVLNRVAWSSRAAAGHLLLLQIKVFVPAGEAVVIGLDDTIERR